MQLLTPDIEYLKQAAFIFLLEPISKNKQIKTPNIILSMPKKTFYF